MQNYHHLNYLIIITSNLALIFPLPVEQEHFPGHELMRTHQYPDGHLLLLPGSRILRLILISDITKIAVIFLQYCI